MPERNVLVVDNYDSFTFNVVRALELAGARCMVVNNDDAGAAALLALEPSGIVLSPGPCTPATAGVCLELIDLLAAAGGPPLLGVCLGHQAIAQAFGARIVRASRALHGKTATMHHDRLGCLRALASPIEVTRYNSLTVEDVSGELEVAGRDEHGEVMALRHRELPIEGVQFHPESHLSPGCLPLFTAWLEGCDRRPLASGAALMQAPAR